MGKGDCGRRAVAGADGRGVARYASAASCPLREEKAWWFSPQSWPESHAQAHPAPTPHHPASRHRPVLRHRARSAAQTPPDTHRDPPATTGQRPAPMEPAAGRAAAPPARGAGADPVHPLLLRRPTGAPVRRFQTYRCIYSHRRRWSAAPRDAAFNRGRRPPNAQPASEVTELPARRAGPWLGGSTSRIWRRRPCRSPPRRRRRPAGPTKSPAAQAGGPAGTCAQHSRVVRRVQRQPRGWAAPSSSRSASAWTRWAAWRSPMDEGEQLAGERAQRLLRRARHSAGASRREDGGLRCGLPHQPGDPDSLGSGLHHQALQHAVQRVELLAGTPLVLSPGAIASGQVRWTSHRRATSAEQRSFPDPPRAVSRPRPPMRTSSSARPTRRSRPAPPTSRSARFPPSRMSSPFPPAGSRPSSSRRRTDAVVPAASVHGCEGRGPRSRPCPACRRGPAAGSHQRCPRTADLGQEREAPPVRGRVATPEPPPEPVLDRRAVRHLDRVVALAPVERSAHRAGGVPDPVVTGTHGGIDGRVIRYSGARLVDTVRTSAASDPVNVSGESTYTWKNCTLLHRRALPRPTWPSDGCRP